MGVFAFARAALLFVVRWRLQIVPLDVLYEEIVRLDPLLLHAGRGNVDFIAETEEGSSNKAKQKKNETIRKYGIPGDEVYGGTKRQELYELQLNTYTATGAGHPSEVVELFAQLRYQLAGMLLHRTRERQRRCLASMMIKLTMGGKDRTDSKEIVS